MSDLVPYDIRDFTWDSIADQRNRFDGVTLRPRITQSALSAKERFTAFDPRKQLSPTISIPLYAPPTNYVNATQDRLERTTSRDTPSQTGPVSREASRTIWHYDIPHSSKPPLGRQHL